MPDAPPTSTTQDDVRLTRGSALKKARKAAGLTALQLVDRVNQRTAGTDITHHALYSYERGKVLLSRELGERLAQVLGLHPGQLLLGDPDYTPAPGSAPGNSSPASGGPTLRRAGQPRSAGDTVTQAELIDLDHLPTPTDLDMLPGALPGGVDPHLRLALIRQTVPMRPVVNVLLRLLGTARRGHVAIHGYFDVFNLLLEDLDAVLNSAAAVEIQRHGEGETNDHPLALLGEYGALREATQYAFDRLLDAADKPMDLFKTARDFRQTLETKFGAIEELAVTCARELPRGCAED